MKSQQGLGGKRPPNAISQSRARNVGIEWKDECKDEGGGIGGCSEVEEEETVETDEYKTRRRKLFTHQIKLKIVKDIARASE